MIPTPGETLCYAIVDLGRNEFRCMNHNKEFVSREQLGEHMAAMKKRWLWRHHPLRALSDWWAHIFADGLG